MVAREAMAAGSTRESKKYHDSTIMSQRIAQDATLRSAWRCCT
jgi:hypothetical protein